MYFFFFKQKTAYEMRISDWSSDVCSSDLLQATVAQGVQIQRAGEPVLEAAAGMRRLVLEIEVDAGERGQALVQQVGVGRTRGFAAQGPDRLAGPVARAARVSLRGHGSAPRDVRNTGRCS